MNELSDIVGKFIRAAVDIYEWTDALLTVCLLAVIVDWGTLERACLELRDDPADWGLLAGIEEGREG